MSNEAEISEIMAKARKQIEEKKAQLGIKTSTTANSIDDKKAAILALKAKIAAASTVHLEPVFEPTVPRLLTPLEQQQNVK